jgi:hypothetical protein
VFTGLIYFCNKVRSGNKALGIYRIKLYQELIMKKTKYLLILVAIVSLSSCGIVKKDCGCPHFGKNKPATETTPAHRYA